MVNDGGWLPRPLSRDAGNCSDRRPFQRETVLRFRIFLAGELEEGRSRNKAAIAVGEIPPLRPEVKDRSPTLAPWWKAERHRHQFDPVGGGAHHGPDVVDPDVVGLRKIEFALAAGNCELQTLHDLAIFAPADVLLIVVAHPVNLGSVSGRRESAARPSILVPVCPRAPDLRF
jgi:hypothetical protein